jgi:hypothetical protein
VEQVQVPTPSRRAEPVPAPAREGELRVRRLILATGGEAREPVGAAETFARADVDRLYAFVEIANRTGGEQEVVVTFEPQQRGGREAAGDPGRVGGRGDGTGQAGDVVGHVELEVGNGARWRTWAYTRMLRAGAWDAVVRDTEGHELARTAFTVTE